MDSLSEIIQLYSKLACEPGADFEWGMGKENADRFGYSKWMDQLPDSVWESNAAGGCPFTLVDIQPGMHVLDVGCGSGSDACVAALLVGPRGLVHAVDVTPAMVDKTRRNAALCGLEARINAIEQSCVFPRLAGSATYPTLIEQESIDVVISNNVFNLVTARAWCFAELFRVLKPGGVLAFIDVIRDADAERANPSVRADAGSFADWVSGTISACEQIGLLCEAGFVDCEFLGLTGYRTSLVTASGMFRARKPQPAKAEAAEADAWG